ncbi:pentatricopeptide repeat-containing protein At2g17140 isoform X2 [Aristolochia californica]|uniref:pentatricopeptide repeat-containing protein At2g17140 isoform X2 n=1 Tax=Aristolochia californica TaxID=171875 RepID=UPI0035DAD863
MAVDHLAKTLRRKSTIHGSCWHLFKQILSSPSPKPTPISISSIVRVLTQSCMLPELDLLHQLLLGLPPDVARVSLALLASASAKYNTLDRAISQFQSHRTNFPSLPPSVRLYNVLLESALRQNRTDLISVLYKDMIRSRTSPDTYTFNILMSSLCEFGCLDDARNLFEKMHLKGCKPNEFSFGILARGYCKCGDSIKALELMDQMGAYGCSPNHVIYNTLITGFCKEGKILEAEKLLERMRSAGIFPNVVTFNSRISALCKSGKVLEAVEIFRDMETSDGVELPKPNLVTFNVMLDGFYKGGMLEEAENLVKTMKMVGSVNKLETYNIWLSGLVRNGKLLEARSVLDEMVESGVQPNGYSYNTVIDGLCKEGMLLDTRSVIILMTSNGVPADVVTYTTLIHGFCRKGEVFEANRILEEMIQKGCSPNTVTCNILLQSLWKQGKVLEAEKLLQKMNERGYGLDIVTCNIVLDGLCKNGKLDKAIEIVDEMWIHGSAALGGGTVREASTLLQEMLQKGIIPNVSSFSLLIKGFCKDGDFGSAQEIFDLSLTILGQKKSLYRLMFNELVSMGGLLKAKELLDMAMERMVGIEGFLYNFFIEELCKKDQLEEAIKILNKMISKGYIFDPATFMPVIDGLAKSGKKHDSDKLSGIMIDMATRRDKLKWKYSYPHKLRQLENGTERESYSEKEVRHRKPKEHVSEHDWQAILHRDDGSGIAMRVLKRVQKGWGQGSIPSLKPQKNEWLDEWSTFV